MESQNLDESVDALVARDARYHRDAYHFLRQALDFTQRELVEPGRTGNTHVTPAELLEGVRRQALKSYGPMAGGVRGGRGSPSLADNRVLEFRPAEAGCFSVTEGDRPEDFVGGYDFEEAFTAPFRPRATPAAVPHVVPSAAPE